MQLPTNHLLILLLCHEGILLELLVLAADHCLFVVLYFDAVFPLNI